MIWMHLRQFSGYLIAVISFFRLRLRFFGLFQSGYEYGCGYKKLKKKLSFTFTFRTIVLIGPKIEKFFLHFSTFPDPLIPKNPDFYIWGIDAIKIVSELVGGFWSYPHFSLF